MSDEDVKRYEELIERCGISAKWASRTPVLTALSGLLQENRDELLQLISLLQARDDVWFAPGHYECKPCYGSGGTVETIGSSYVPCRQCKPHLTPKV